MKHTISVLVQNKFGVLARIAGLFSGRGYNIDSLCVAETQDPEFSQMTILTHGEEAVIDQIIKQLNKLIDVVKVTDFREREYVGRDLALVKVNTTAQTRGEILQIVNIFRAKVIDISPKSLTIEVTGDEPKITAIIEMLKVFGIRELARTGRVAMSRK